MWLCIWGHLSLGKIQKDLHLRKSIFAIMQVKNAEELFEFQLLLNTHAKPI